jgi:hypothetical protein
MWPWCGNDSPRFGGAFSCPWRCRIIVGMISLFVGTKVRFLEQFGPPQVRWGTVGTIVDMEERDTPHGPQTYVRARFGDFITPWIEAWQLERVES